MADIRDARVDDVPGILAIYNDVIATSTAVYREDPATLDDRRQWFESRVAQAYPVIVAADDSGIVGFASYGDFRTWPGYRFTVEQVNMTRGHILELTIVLILLFELWLFFQGIMT